MDEPVDAGPGDARPAPRIVDTLSVTPATIVLATPGGGTVPTTVRAAGRTMTITPVQRLSSNSFMTAKITAQVRDGAGNALAVDFSWTFTTGFKTDV